MTDVVELETLGAQKPRRMTPAYEDKIVRYHVDLHAPLRKLAQRSQAHADIITSFPAAAISLVSNRLAPNVRANAMDLCARVALCGRFPRR